MLSNHTFKPFCCLPKNKEIKSSRFTNELIQDKFELKKIIDTELKYNL